MSNLNSCTICFKPFKPEYTIWNASSMDYHYTLHKIYNISYDKCSNYFIYYNMPPRLMCFKCFEYYNTWNNYNGKQKINYILHRNLGKNIKIKKSIQTKKNKSKDKCILCNSFLTKSYYKNMYGVHHLGPLCYYCFI